MAIHFQVLKAVSYTHLDVYKRQVFDELEPGVVEIRLLGDKEFLKTSQVGNDLIFRHHARTHPAFYVTYSKDICLLYTSRCV